MIVKPDNFSDSCSDTSTLLSPLSGLEDLGDLALTYDELRRQVSRIRTDHSTGKEIPYPELHSHTFDEWIDKFEHDLNMRFISCSQWSDAAIIFLTGSGKVNMAMRKIRAARILMEVDYWPWEKFKSDLYDTLVQIENEPSFPQIFQKDYPGVITAAKITAGTGLVVAGSAVIVPALGVAALNGIGFTASGVASGSAAAAIQSAIYGGATTGLFSLCQSIGATAVVASGSAIASSFGAVAAGASLLSSGNREQGLDA